MELGLASATAEALESGLDFGGQTGDQTTTGSQVHTGLDVLGEAGSASTLEEGLERLLELVGQDNVLASGFGSTEDTLEGNQETALGGDVSALGRQNRQTSRNVNVQKAVVTTGTPVQKGRTETRVEVTTVTAQPASELLACGGVNGTSLNTHRTSLEGSGGVCADARENVGRALATTTTEEAGDETAQVEVHVDINVETKSPAVHGLVGREGESGARQTGEHENVVGTHRVRW